MDDKSMQSLWESSALSGGNVNYIEAMYEAYQQDPNSVDAAWRAYFEQLPATEGGMHTEILRTDVRDHFLAISKQRYTRGNSAATGSSAESSKQAHVLQLINAYRSHGHLHAKLDPLDLSERTEVPDLALHRHALSEADMDTEFNIDSPICGGRGKLRDIYRALNEIYCDSIGVEYTHISDHTETAWLQQRLENVQHRNNITKQQKIDILAKLTAAEGLEKYLATRYVGQKRFGLEGGDSLIPMLHAMVDSSVSEGAKEIVLGMAHRGRLNVLVNMLGKAPARLFEEFEGKSDESGTGDVKYHKGFSSDIQTPAGNVHLTLSFNPSHLEIISPVVEGSVRARQRRRNDVDRKQVMPIIIHGDSAFAGQGVVQETFNMSQARGYCTGGTIHIVINNQIGFTTSNPLDTRSTLYCTDISKMVQAPVFHVNADDAEAVVFVAKLALDYRTKFAKDVVIDLVCYRRHGHNESDEPTATQPIMYQRIKKHPTARTIYADKLIAEGVVDKKQSDDMARTYRDKLDAGEQVVDACTKGISNEFSVDWTPYQAEDWTEAADTGVSKETLSRLAQSIESLPEGFNLQPQVKKMMADRRKMSAGDAMMNWGYAETMAYATLLDEGHVVRISGQDSGRGTFAHRHAVLHDHKNGQIYTPLQNIPDQKGQFIVIDSVLSEAGVLGFEYGYSTGEPNALVIWEAQFGDFANGAQVVIDQFISSGYQKWGRLCGLTMFLPHGYEGQGPEHSSARLERYLQLCAQHNIQVCIPSTPAQTFHMLRRQMKRSFRTPLVVMTPKSLLRHPLAVSPVDDLTNGKFHCVIPEIEQQDIAKVRRVIMCSGKVYYDLLAKRRENKQDDIAIIRIEQMYPFPEEDLKQHLQPYQHVKDIVWCQEEPENQGVWYSMRHHMRACLQDDQILSYVGRTPSAAPAAGYMKLFNINQSNLVNQALAE